MAAAQREKDRNKGGGEIKKVIQHTVFVNNRPLSVDGSIVAPHSTHRTSSKTANGMKTVMAENRPVNRQNDKDTCGHPRDGGSSNVKIGG